MTCDGRWACTGVEWGVWFKVVSCTAHAAAVLCFYFVLYFFPGCFCYPSSPIDLRFQPADMVTSAFDHNTMVDACDARR